MRNETKFYFVENWQIIHIGLKNSMSQPERKVHRVDGSIVYLCLGNVLEQPGFIEQLYFRLLVAPN